MPDCVICGRNSERGKSYTLTPEEKTEIERLGDEPPKAVFYCAPCHKIIQDPVSAPLLLRGLMEASLRQNGVKNASALADHFHAALTQASKGKDKS